MEHLAVCFWVCIIAPKNLVSAVEVRIWHVVQTVVRRTFLCDHASRKESCKQFLFQATVDVEPTWKFSCLWSQHHLTKNKGEGLHVGGCTSQLVIYFSFSACNSKIKIIQNFLYLYLILLLWMQGNIEVLESDLYQRTKYFKIFSFVIIKEDSDLKICKICVPT
jgi:hypothetical protein